VRPVRPVRLTHRKRNKSFADAPVSERKTCESDEGNVQIDGHLNTQSPIH